MILTKNMIQMGILEWYKLILKRQIHLMKQKKLHLKKEGHIQEGEVIILTKRDGNRMRRMRMSLLEEMKKNLIQINISTITLGTNIIIIQK